MRRELPTVVYMLLAIGVVLWTIVLFGCAPEREAPIYKWRVAYGFEPARPD